MKKNFQDGFRSARSAIKNIPNASKFQERNSGKLLSGKSGIVPFNRSYKGMFTSPGARQKNNFIG